jgi:hypothetical protein
MQEENWFLLTSMHGSSADEIKLTFQLSVFLKSGRPVHALDPISPHNQEGNNRARIKPTRAPHGFYALHWKESSEWVAQRGLSRFHNLASIKLKNACNRISRRWFMNSSSAVCAGNTPWKIFKCKTPHLCMQRSPVIWYKIRAAARVYKI